MCDEFRPFPMVRTTPIVRLNPFIIPDKKVQIFQSSSISNTDNNYRKILIPKDLNKQPKFQQKGLIFVWPQKRTVYHNNKKLLWLTWMLAHGLYWMHLIDVLPSGTGNFDFQETAFYLSFIINILAVPFEQPPWKYDTPTLHRPHSRDFIIEPDWDSHYNI